MFFRNARAIMTAGILAMAAALPVVHAEEAQSHCGPGCAPANPCGPQFREICVTECVPEYYTTYKTCYKHEKVCETYTAYKCVKVPCTKTRTVTHYKKVPVWKVVKKPYCVTVPCTKTVTVMEKHWVKKQVTTYRTKWVDKGHYEYKCVERGPSLFDRLSGMFNKKCCDPCDPCCDSCKPAPRYKTKKVWVPCKVCVKIPCTRCKRVCEYRPVCKTIHTCRKETRWKEEKVCTYKCIPCTKTETYTECVTKKVPFTAKRWVCKKVAYKKPVTCCRMVKRVVKKKVPVCDPCGNDCGGCGNGCH